MKKRAYETQLVVKIAPFGCLCIKEINHAKKIYLDPGVIVDP